VQKGTVPSNLADFTRKDLDLLVHRDGDAVLDVFLDGITDLDIDGVR
jgi:hypothetical protein